MGSPIIFFGNKAKLLKPNLNFFGNVDILTGAVDPSSVATSANEGSLYLNNSNGLTYRKADNGLSTNWVPFVDSSSPGPANTYIVDATNGNDTSGVGSYAAPYKTLQKAATVIGSAVSNAEFNDATKSYYNVKLFGSSTETTVTFGTRPNIVLDMSSGVLNGDLVIQYNQGAIFGANNQQPHFSITGSDLRAGYLGLFGYSGINGNVFYESVGSGSSLVAQLHMINTGVTGDIHQRLGSGGGVLTLGVFLTGTMVAGKVICDTSPSAGALTLYANNSDSSGSRSIGGATGAVQIYQIHNVRFVGTVVVQSAQGGRWFDVQFAAVANDFTGSSGTTSMDANSFESWQVNVPSKGTVASSLLDTSRGVKYTPTTSGDWNSVPATVLAGLDTLATSGIVKSQSANLILASPDGSSGLPSFRALTITDIPAGNYVTDPTAVVAGQGLFEKNAGGTATFLAGYADGTKFSAFDALPVNTALFMGNIVGSPTTLMSTPPAAADTTSSSGFVSLSSGSVVNTSSTGASGLIDLYTGTNLGLGATGGVFSQSGDISNASNTVATGVVQIFSGSSSGTGNSGAVSIKSGNKKSGAAGGTSGTLVLNTGAIQQSTLSGVTGILTVASGASNGTGATGATNVNTGNQTNAAASAASGALTTRSGTTAGSGTTGAFSAGSGAATSTGASGLTTLSSGNSTSGSSGNVAITSGNGSVNSGNINLTTGTAGTTRGNVNIDSASLSVTSSTAIVTFNTSELRGVVDPTLAQSAATKNYVDSNFVAKTTGDIPVTSFTAANNQSSAANVTGLAFSTSTVRAFEALVSISVVATSSLFEVYTLRGIYNGTSWDMSQTSNGDASLFVFSITNAGQVQYTDANYSGFTSATLKFRAIVTPQ